MPYYIDFEKVSLDKYKDMLRISDLVPSRVLLMDNINENFDKIEAQSIKNVKELIDTLKSKDKIKKFSAQSQISEGYLTVLNREIKGNL